MNKTGRGFTLIELLVAISIFAIMSVVAYRGLNGVLQARQQVTAESAKWQELALFFARVESDFVSVIDRPVRDAGDLDALPFIGKALVASQEEAVFELSRTGYAGQSGQLADVQRVAYRLRETAVEQLVWPVLDRAPRSQPEYFAVLSGVREMKLRYLDDKGAWQTAWPAPGQGGLPRAVEMSLTLRSGETLARMFAL